MDSSRGLRGQRRLQAPLRLLLRPRPGPDQEPTDRNPAIKQRHLANLAIPMDHQLWTSHGQESRLPQLLDRRIAPIIPRLARNFKPGYHPIAAISDPTVIVNPADSTFDGQWEIRSNSGVTLKNLDWKISELLAGSPYADRFEGGIFRKSQYQHFFSNGRSSRPSWPIALLI